MVLRIDNAVARRMSYADIPPGSHVVTFDAGRWEHRAGEAVLFVRRSHILSALGGLSFDSHEAECLDGPLRAGGVKGGRSTRRRPVVPKER